MSEQEHAREARYAEAILAEVRSEPSVPGYERLARAVVAVADAEQAELRRTVYAEVAATLNDRADMWESERRPGLVFENRNLANAYRTYAEGVGVPSYTTLRELKGQRIAELEAALQRSRDAHQGAVERLRAVEALADGWAIDFRDAPHADRVIAKVTAELRAALAPATSPAERESDRD